MRSRCSCASFTLHVPPERITRPMAEPVMGMCSPAMTLNTPLAAAISIFPSCGHEAERRAVRLRDVRHRLEEALEHAPRVELQRDLLPEPPHALQHALRVVQLQRALHHALLERGLGSRSADILVCSSSAARRSALSA